mmetsp:Transcript_12699/g.30985  ORF Transcript_12699/g.30985 Transcript_12699/m.30985 type:complete len:97 (+) Transcript_12699:1011-1301(+)
MRAPLALVSRDHDAVVVAPSDDVRATKSSRLDRSSMMSTSYSNNAERQRRKVVDDGRIDRHHSFFDSDANVGRRRPFDRWSSSILDRGRRRYHVGR